MEVVVVVVFNFAYNSDTKLLILGPVEEAWITQFSRETYTCQKRDLTKGKWCCVG